MKTKNNSQFKIQPNGSDAGLWVRGLVTNYNHLIGRLIYVTKYKIPFGLQTGVTNYIHL